MVLLSHVQQSFIDFLKVKKKQHILRCLDCKLKKTVTWTQQQKYIKIYLRSNLVHL